MIILSVIIPTYNNSKYISRCLDSIVDQKTMFGDIEYIIIDDGSTDNTYMILQKYLEKYSNIIYKYQDNKKQGAARNYGLSIARGKYITFIDSDDFVCYNNIFNIMLSLAEQYNVDIVQTIGFKYVDSNSTYISKKEDAIPQPTFFTSKDYILMNKFNYSTVTSLYKKSIFDENKIVFRENCFFEDTDTSVKLLYYAHNIIMIDFIYYCYCYNQESSTRKVSVKRMFDNIDGQKELLNFAYNKVEDSDIQNIISNRVKYVVLSYYKLVAKEYSLNETYDIYKYLKGTNLLSCKSYKLSIIDLIKLFIYRNLFFFLVLVGKFILKTKKILCFFR